MERVAPWPELLKALEPFYYPVSAGARGRPPIGLERMLRMPFPQQRGDDGRIHQRTLGEQQTALAQLCGKWRLISGSLEAAIQRLNLSCFSP
ncbi:hypothetical protein THIOKS11100001 [Thiocapsa sp. KS1]|nr:hypothetical protein THIOKS11100001 [Thiocapsa sp. KS1]